MQKLSPDAIWRPADEAMAAGNMAAFILWLGACRGVVLAGPAPVAAWEAAAPEEFSKAICGFAGIEPGLGYAASLARGGGRIVLLQEGARREVAAAALVGGNIPLCIASMLAAGHPALLAGQATDALLRLELRPDERLLWAGALSDPWPLCVLLAGATLILCAPPPDDAEAVAAAERARVLRRPV